VSLFNVSLKFNIFLETAVHSVTFIAKFFYQLGGLTTQMRWQGSLPLFSQEWGIKDEK
jgi:hypothetical protein